MIRWFLMGKGGKGDYGWLQGDVVFESHFVATCTGMMYLFVDLCRQIRINDDDEGEMPCEG